MNSDSIEALRERGADRFDPIRFRFIEALARRSAAHGGDVRRLLDDKLARLLAEYRERFENARADPVAVPSSTAPLKHLLAHLERQAGPTAELKTLSAFRSTWSKLSVDRRLTRSLAKLPENAGPLHSHGLVLRSLESMRELSPAYLDRFMSYVEGLLWLDQAKGGSAPPQRDVLRAGGEKKRKPGRGAASKSGL